jgi:hypothetical protein
MKHFKRWVLLFWIVVWVGGLSSACQKKEEVDETPPAEVMVQPLEHKPETLGEAEKEQAYRKEMVERSETMGASGDVHE